MLKVGDPAPDFALTNQDGKTVHLSDFRGKKVVMFAYPAAFTSGCTTQACGFRDKFPTLSSHNVVVLGISPDAPEKQLAWKKQENLPYDLLSDEKHQVLAQWGAWGEKESFGKKSEGVIRSHWVIDEKGVLLDQKIGVKPLDSVEEAVKAAV